MVGHNLLLKLLLLFRQGRLRFLSDLEKRVLVEGVESEKGRGFMDEELTTVYEDYNTKR